jgi:hypothetical protein
MVVVQHAVRGTPLPPKRREISMKLTRLEFTQHPRPPQRDLRQRGVFDPAGNLIGHVANVYVDDDRKFRFVDIAMGGFMGLGKEHHLVPVEAVAEAEPGFITLKVDRRTVRSAPALGDPHAAPDGTMHVRVSTMHILASEFDRVLHFFRNAMYPATEMSRGFRGGILISDQGENKIVTASWWDSQERREATGHCTHVPEHITGLLTYLVGLPTIANYQFDAPS